MRAYMCKQYSPDWWALRAGVPTASGFDRIFTGGGKVSGQQEKYIEELLRDRETPVAGGFTEDGKRIGTPAMRAGRDAEPEARMFYAMDRGVTVHQVGFVSDPNGWFGCSPDGLVNPKSTARGRDAQGRLWVECVADGGLELKCPLPETQEKYLKRGQVLPTEYKPQVHGQLVVTGLPWWDFLSYCPGHDPILVRVTPDDYTAALAEALREFLEKYQRAIDSQLLGVGPVSG